MTKYFDTLSEEIYKIELQEDVQENPILSFNFYDCEDSAYRKANERYYATME